MPIAENIRLLIEWAPALQLFSAIASAAPGRDRAVQIAKLGEFLASKTESTVDDRLVRLVTDILLTPQAGALIEYLTELVKVASESKDVGGHSGI